ncbi:hypothetical protein L838_1902 [Mycobacterium avium MAV_120709_2344]|nr:hypothetical protein L838_1902 [Mycobacterium avium MAV_120709_2344]
MSAEEAGPATVCQDPVQALALGLVSSDDQRLGFGVSEVYWY